jgi:hypothetical protein
MFIVVFLLGSGAIPIVLHDDRRIYPDWPDWKFIVFGLILTAGYAAFLSGCSVFFARFIRKR